MAWLIEMLFGMWAWVGPSNHVLDGVRIPPPGEEAILGVGIHGHTHGQYGIFNKMMRRFIEFLQSLVIVVMSVAESSVCLMPILILISDLCCKLYTVEYYRNFNSLAIRLNLHMSFYVSCKMAAIFPWYICGVDILTHQIGFQTKQAFCNTCPVLRPFSWWTVVNCYTVSFLLVLFWKKMFGDRFFMGWMYMYILSPNQRLQSTKGNML